MNAICVKRDAMRVRVRARQSREYVGTGVPEVAGGFTGAGVEVFADLVGFDGAVAATVAEAVALGAGAATGSGVGAGVAVARVGAAAIADAVAVAVEVVSVGADATGFAITFA